MNIVSEKIKNGLNGEIVIPSDKSISHRAIMFSSLAEGESLITNFSKGADCHSTLKVFKSLGIESIFKDETTVLIKSNGGLVAPNGELYCGNSGTTMRLMSGILAGKPFESILTGDESLSKRPMKRVIEPLRLMGAEISSNENKSPLVIKGRNLTGIEYKSPLASAQVKSCILLAGLDAEGTTTVVEPYLSRNHTEKMLEYLGAEITCEQTTASVKKSKLVSKPIVISGDISSATFFIVAALIVPNSDIIIKNVGLNPTRTGILDVCKMMGADIEILNKALVSNEEVGDIRVKTSDLHACEISGDIIPRLIDELPAIAVLATQAEGITVVKDAQDLRNKESDRIKSTVCELKKVGAKIEETLDGFVIEGKSTLSGDVEIETYHDHRLAMSMYVAGMVCEKQILIKDFEWVDISFPEFLELVERIRV